MNLVFNNENCTQNSNQLQFQQILNLQNAYNQILQSNPNLSCSTIQPLLLQHLIQLQNIYQYGLNSAPINALKIKEYIPYAEIGNPPEYPIFPQFPQTYNIQYDQLNQLQDPKCKYNLGSQKDKEGGGNLNLSELNYASSNNIRIMNDQISQDKQSYQPQSIKPAVKQTGFQRVIKKSSPTIKTNTSTVIENSNSSNLLFNNFQNCNVVNNINKIEDFQAEQKQNQEQIISQITEIRSPSGSIFMGQKMVEQETNSYHLDVGNESFGNTQSTYAGSPSKKNLIDDVSSTFFNPSHQAAIPAWLTLLKESNFEKLKNIQDIDMLKQIATYVFLNQQPNNSSSIQFNQHQNIFPFNSNIENELINQHSQAVKEQSHFGKDVIQSSLNSVAQCSSAPSSSSSSSSTNAQTLNLSNCKQTQENKKGYFSQKKDSCETMASSSEKNFENDQQGQNCKADSEQILFAINSYLCSLNLKVNFQKNENYELIFNKKCQSQLPSSYAAGQLINPDVMSQEDQLDSNNLGISSSENIQEDRNSENDNDDLIAQEPIKVKKRQGLNHTISLQSQQSQIEMQRNNPENIKQIEFNNSKTQFPCKGNTNNQNSGNIPSNTEKNSVQDNFMNARRNKKREQKIQQTIEQNSQLSTKFHNLTRLLMYKIIKIFKDEQNLKQNYSINSELWSHLKRICGRIKQHSRDTCKSQIKTNFYTHSHYNALFLVLNEDNIKVLKTNSKDVDAHSFIFGLDLTNPNPVHVTFANIIKSVAYEIVNKNLQANIINEQLQSSPQQNSNNPTTLNNLQASDHMSHLRSLYFQRAFQGITKMNNGLIVSRF